MIAGYNTMTPQQKKNVDIKKLSRLLRNNFVVMGSAVIIWGCVSTRTGWPSAYASFIIMIITVIVWIITVVVIAQKYDHNN